MENLENIVKALINTKDEGGYWDFKEFWEEEKNISDLLHDIICMANNLEDKDAYIIYGIKNDSFQITGIENTPNRKNRQSVIDFLKDKHFAGGIKPTVDLKCINIENHELDILIIKNSDNTPFYLEERYKDVQSNLIYTRIKDTNTPKDKNADIDKIEYLWKKRFGLTRNRLDEFLKFTEDYNNWEKDIGNKDILFYKLNPEHKISIKELMEYKEPLADFYLNPSSTIYKAILQYNTTPLYETYILAVDEARKFIIIPKSALYDGLNLDSRYYYYIKTSIEGKLLYLITDGSYNLISREYFEIPIIFFESESEKNIFENFAIQHKNETLIAEINEFKSHMINHQIFNEKHDSYIKSYILYKKWKKFME